MSYALHMAARSFLIFTAVRAEAQAIDKALRFAGLLKTVDIRIIGIRAPHLPSAVTAPEIRGIILAGFAGGLDPALHIGDVVVDGLPRPCSGEAAFRTGRIHTALGIVSTPAQKAALYLQTGAIAVDMEGEKVRRFAELLGVSFIHVRAISDTAKEALDPVILNFVDEFGRVRPLALAGGLLQRPQLISKLVRLGMNARVAGIRLGKVVAELVALDSA